MSDYKQTPLWKFRSYLASVAKKRPLRASQSVSDLVHSTLIEGAKRESQIKGKSDEERRAYLRAILIGKIARHFRGQRLPIISLARSSANLGSLLVDRFAEVPGDDTECLHLKMVRVLEAMERLPQKHRDALRLYYLEEKKLKEIATEMGVNHGNVSRWITAGIKELRKTLKEND